MRFTLCAIQMAVLCAVSIATQPALGANVVADRERTWAGHSIPVVICEMGVDKSVRSHCGRTTTARATNSLTRTEAAQVRRAIADWNETFEHHIVLRESRRSLSNQVVFRRSRKDGRCSTQGVGFQERQRRKYVSLGARCNPAMHPEGTAVASIIHEIMHVVGVYHEQQRSDREKLLTVVSRKGAPNSFQWRPLCDPKTRACKRSARRATPVGEYDLGSIMHYSLREKTSRRTIKLTPIGADTLRRNGLRSRDVGQRSSLSATDIRAVKKLYPVTKPVRSD